MYLGTELGQSEASKDRVLWASISRDLVIPFKRDFGDFREEVRKALGRYVTFRSDGGAYLDRLLSSEPTFLTALRIVHKPLVDAAPPTAELTPVHLLATFYYTPGFKKVTRITFP